MVDGSCSCFRPQVSGLSTTGNFLHDIASQASHRIWCHAAHTAWDYILCCNSYAVLHILVLCARQTMHHHTRAIKPTDTCAKRTTNNPFVGCSFSSSPSLDLLKFRLWCESLPTAIAYQSLCHVIYHRFVFQQARCIIDIYNIVCTAQL